MNLLHAIEIILSKLYIFFTEYCIQRTAINQLIFLSDEKDRTFSTSHWFQYWRLSKTNWSTWQQNFCCKDCGRCEDSDWGTSWKRLCKFLVRKLPSSTVVSSSTRIALLYVKIINKELKNDLYSLLSWLCSTQFILTASFDSYFFFNDRSNWNQYRSKLTDIFWTELDAWRIWL